MLYSHQNSYWLTIVANVTVAQFLNHCSAQALPGVTEAGGGIDSGAKKATNIGLTLRNKNEVKAFPFLHVTIV